MSVESVDVQRIRDGLRTLVGLGRYDEAQSICIEYRKAAGILDPEAYVVEADIYLARGDREQAFRLLEQGLIADCTNPALLVSLGDLYFSAGHEGFQRVCFEDAAFCYARALSRGAGERSGPVMEHLMTIEAYRQDSQLREASPDELPLPSLTTGQGFIECLLRSVFEHSNQFYPYNIDLELAKAIGLPPGSAAMVNPTIERQQVLGNLAGIERLHSLLDEPSRGLLTAVMTYRVLGNWHVKLPIDTPDYWAKRFLAKTLAGPKLVRAQSDPLPISLFDLKEIGYPLQVYSVPNQICGAFLVKQYESAGFVRPEEGDVVIDCGACWGDTALYFAHEVGAQGEVHSFEFIASNLDILRQNLQGNPELGSRVRVAEHPVWDQSGVPMNFLDIGPGSCVNPESLGAGPTVATIAIDDYVKQAGLKRVDFIKMDIEGAELRALKGAVETLRAFRPKLAIALYHQVSDFAQVAAFLDDLGLGYSFRLDHFTPQLWETALFAVSR